jgi:hypothetical protein
VWIAAIQHGVPWHSPEGWSLLSEPFY